jgi:rubrerythrin
MVDPTSNRTLRIYPLDTITKWEVKEPSVFTFWAKSAVDIDQRMIQLKSSSYTTTAILDTLTAACVQLCEMVKPSDGSSLSSGPGTAADTSTIKKGSVLDWVALRPRVATEEEKQHWVPDEAVTKCTSCDSDFGAFLRRHHCRNCGDIFCDKCTRGRISLNTDEDSQPVRVCDRCLAEVTHRLENMTKASSKISAPQRTHEDLARKLQEELERNQASRKPVLSTSSSGNGNSRQTSVLNCSKCGSISLVVGNSSSCSNCGADPGSMSSRTEKTTSSFGASAGPPGPPHLWSSNASVPDGPQMREVACPTCTVHLQVQVPNFGTETVECGVCQHPFLVSA